MLLFLLLKFADVVLFQLQTGLHRRLRYLPHLSHNSHFRLHRVQVRPFLKQRLVQLLCGSAHSRHANESV